MGTVLCVQNVIAQMITGPLSQAREVHFNIYYLILLIVSGSIVFYSYLAKKSRVSPTPLAFAAAQAEQVP